MASSPRSRRSLVPYVLLVTALAITAGVARYAHNQIARQDSLRFEDATKRVFAEIDNRLDAYIAMLHGGAGLFAGSKRVEFLEFRAYVEGDDPRFVDWNVFARTERTYIRRYEGETNKIGRAHV